MGPEFRSFYPFSPLLVFLFYASHPLTTFMKFYRAFNYLYENSFPISLLFNKMINSCNVKLQQRHLEDIIEKLVHFMPITMQCCGNLNFDLYFDSQ